MIGIEDFLSEGYAVFGLRPIVDGKCTCGDDKCMAVGKHPRPNAWQLTKPYSDELFTQLDDLGEFDTGYGVLLQGSDLFVVDVDARNGGLESFERLCGRFPWLLDSERTMHVLTGSGDGSLHVYLRVNGRGSLRQNMPEYQGIDFKSTGYVVGPNSMHVSGNRYKVKSGDIYNLMVAPEEFTKMLAVPDAYNVLEFGVVTDDDIRDYLGYIDASCDYQTWVHVGMALHHTLGGCESGFVLWDEWSKKSKKYPTMGALQRKWHSFGKCSQPITMHTLRALAIEGGWTPEYEVLPAPLMEENLSIEEISHVDLLRPSGFVGEVAAWIRSQCMHPREHLAVAAALYVVSCAAGMRHVDGYSNIPANIYLFGIAGSGTGKNDILRAIKKLLVSAGLSRAIHGAIKSDAEIYRNLVDNKACFYLIDEFGEALSQIVKARNGKSAHYLQGVVATLMEAFTSANGTMLIKGDEKRALRKEMQAKLNSVINEHGENPQDDGARQAIEDLKQAIEDVNVGLKNPYVSLMGLTTPDVFEGLMTYDMVTNGFLGRCIIVNEFETNPYRNKDFSPSDVPDEIASTLRYLYSEGQRTSSKVAKYGTESLVTTDVEGTKLLGDVYDDFWQLSEYHKTHTGLEAVPRRGFELVCRVSFLLAIPHGVRTAEMIRWAYKIVRQDIDRKIAIAGANSSIREDDKLIGRILARVPSKGDTITHGVLLNKCETKEFNKEMIEKALQSLIDSGRVIVAHSTGKGPKTKKYHLPS